MKYRQIKRIEVDAEQITVKSYPNVHKLLNEGKLPKEKPSFYKSRDSRGILIGLPFSERYGNRGLQIYKLNDWIVKKENGDVVSYSPDKFEKLYELVEPGPSAEDHD